MTEANDLIVQLAALHRGRGVRRADLGAWLADPLRKALGLSADMPEAQLVRHTFSSLKDATRGLPEDLRVVFLVASGIASSERLLTRRLAEAATHLDRGERTMQRRLVEANAMVAAVLLRRLRRTGPASVTSSWYVDAMASTVRFDRDRPEFIARREIVLTHRLAVISEPISIPRPDRGELTMAVEVEVLDGGVLESLDRTSASSWNYRVDPGRVLEPGDRHAYSVLVRMPSRTFIRPYAVMVPLRECREFAVTVHFDPDWVPAPIHLVDTIPPVALEDESTGPEMPLSADTSVSASFSDLASGYAYGVRWRGATADPAH